MSLFLALEVRQLQAAPGGRSEQAAPGTHASPGRRAVLTLGREFQARGPRRAEGEGLRGTAQGNRSGEPRRAREEPGGARLPFLHHRAGSGGFPPGPMPSGAVLPLAMLQP